MFKKPSSQSLFFRTGGVNIITVAEYCKVLKLGPNGRAPFTAVLF